MQNAKKTSEELRYSFVPDNEIFESIIFSPKKLHSFIKMKAVLVKGAKISFTVDKDLIHDTTPNHAEFYYPNGIIDLMKENFEKRKKLFRNFFMPI